MCHRKWQGLTDNQSLNICGVMHQIPWSLYETCTSWGWFWKIQRSGWGYLCTKYGVQLFNLTTSSKAHMFHPLKNWKLIQWGMQSIRMGVKKWYRCNSGGPMCMFHSNQWSSGPHKTPKNKRCEPDNFCVLCVCVCIYIYGWLIACSPCCRAPPLNGTMGDWKI